MILCMGEFNTKIGAEIRVIRKKRGWTLQVLGDECGLSRSYLSQMETGSCAIPIDTLQIIADALGVKVSTVVRRAEK